MTKSNKATRTAAKQAKAKDADLIKTSKAANATQTDIHMITSEGGESYTFPTDIWQGAVRKATGVGQSFSAAKVVITEAMTKRPASGLAKGVDARSAPHSHKALGDDRTKERAVGKADGKQAKDKAKADRKADRASRASPKADDNRKITILKKDFAFGREGTARRLSWEACLKSKTVAEFAAKGGKLKYLPRWATAGAVKLG